MYKYRVEVFDGHKLMLYENICADGYCAELEARKKYPNYTIGQVQRMEDNLENDKLKNISIKGGNIDMIKVMIDKELILYSDEDLASMTKGQLKQLKQDLQCNMEEVSAKKAKYNAENTEAMNSKEYFKRIAKYKTVMANLKRAIAKVNVYEKDADESELKHQEHWLWCFYTIVKNSMTEKAFKELIEETDEKAKYHCTIGE